MDTRESDIPDADLSPAQAADEQWHLLDIEAECRPVRVDAADLAEIDVGCPKCGYNLRGGAGENCPECGIRLLTDEVFPPIHDLSLLPAFDTKRPCTPRRFQSMGPAIVMVMVCGIGAMALLLTAGSGGVPGSLGAIAGAMGVVMAVSVAGVGLKRYTRRFRWTLLVVCAILVGLYLVIVWEMS